MVHFQTKSFLLCLSSFTSKITFTSKVLLVKLKSEIKQPTRKVDFPEKFSKFSWKLTFRGNQLSWEVYFPGKSTSPGNLLSWGIKIPGKSQALHAHGVLSREVSFSRTSTFPGSLLSRSAWINKDFVITYFNSMQHSKH